jgi:citrate synthase
MGLLELADANGTAGPHVAVGRCVRPQRRRGALPLNVSGAIDAAMMDLGFPLDAMPSIPILAPAAGILARFHEDADERLGFYLAARAADAVSYDDPAIDTP